MDAIIRPPRDISLLSDLAYEAIREAILDFRLKPGSALVETRLAEALNMSKTPIRHALKQLEQTGLVTAAPYRGYAVSELTLRDAWEILQLRTVLEGLAAKEACANLIEADIAELIKLQNDAEGAFKEGNLEECARLGHEFHRFLVHKAENQRLTAMIEQLNDQFSRIRRLSYQVPGRLSRSNNEHELILEALQDKNPERADALMRDHLLAVYEDLKEDEMLSRSGYVVGDDTFDLVGNQDACAIESKHDIR